jgi:hypothetical protein
VSDVKGGCKVDAGDDVASVVMEAVAERASGKTGGGTSKAILDVVVSVMIATGIFIGMEEFVCWCCLSILKIWGM